MTSPLFRFPTKKGKQCICRCWQERRGGIRKRNRSQKVREDRSLPFTLTKRFVILCEGPADQVFFQKLLEYRGIRDFDVPPHSELGKYWGVAGVGRTFRALAGYPAGYARLKGVLVIVDGARSTTFRDVCKKIREDGPFVAPADFVRPTAPNVTAKQSPGHPSISIMLIPLGRTGALETICADAITHRRP
jgi:hypothetical protein